MENEELRNKLYKTNEQIDNLLREEVNVYFINIVGDELLVNMNTRNLPCIKMKKGELQKNIINEKLEYLLGSNITNLMDVPFNLYEDNTIRYFTFDFVEQNRSSSNQYINISVLKDMKLLTMIKAILNKRSS